MQHERRQRSAGLSVSPLHGRQFHTLLLAKATLDAPAEYHAGCDVMLTADRRHAHAGLFRFKYDGELFLVRETAPVRASIARQITLRHVCQDCFRRTILSSAANIPAYFRADARMKTHPPINPQRIRIQPGTPRAQGIGPRCGARRRSPWR